MRTTTTALIALAWSLLTLCGCDNAGEADDEDTDTTDDLDPALNCEGGRLDPATGLCWQDPPAECGWCDYDPNSSYQYCDLLDLAGHDDWVLPSLEDFVALLGGCDEQVMNGGEGYCDSCEESETCTAAFPDDTDYYWTSTTHGSGFWHVVNLGSGSCFLAESAEFFQIRVRCVRDTL